MKCRCLAESSSRGSARTSTLSNLLCVDDCDGERTRIVRVGDNDDDAELLLLELPLALELDVEESVAVFVGVRDVERVRWEVAVTDGICVTLEVHGDDCDAVKLCAALGVGDCVPEADPDADDDIDGVCVRATVRVCVAADAVCECVGLLVDVGLTVVLGDALVDAVVDFVTCTLRVVVELGSGDTASIVDVGVHEDVNEIVSALDSLK